MATTYEVIAASDALERELPGVEEWWDGMDTDDMSGIWRCEDGVPIECLATDGGEPEDNSFRRDGSWISGALKRAYDLGWTRAMAQSNVPPHRGGGEDGKELD